jgi:hypothetical protein
MDLTILYYAAAGLVGGIVFVLMPPMVTDLKTIIQHIGLGAIVGGISYLTLSSQAATSIGTPLSYLTTITAGYLAIDFLSNFVAKPPASSGGNQEQYQTVGSNIPK